MNLKKLLYYINYQHPTLNPKSGKPKALKLPHRAQALTHAMHGFPQFKVRAL